jgi:hypothetical protein
MPLFLATNSFCFWPSCVHKAFHYNQVCQACRLLSSNSWKWARERERHTQNGTDGSHMANTIFLALTGLHPFATFFTWVEWWYGATWFFSVKMQKSNKKLLRLKTVAHSKKRCFDLMISSHEHSNLVPLQVASHCWQHWEATFQLTQDVLKPRGVSRVLCETFEKPGTGGCNKIKEPPNTDWWVHSPLLFIGSGASQVHSSLASQFDWPIINMSGNSLLWHSPHAPPKKNLAWKIHCRSGKWTVDSTLSTPNTTLKN